MRVIKIIVVNLAVAISMTASGALFAPLTAQEPSGAGCRWQSAFPQHLGIDTRFDIADGQSVRTVEAFISDPDRLHSMGLFGVKPGQRIKMFCIGSDLWRIKHYATGQQITFSTKPF